MKWFKTSKGKKWVEEEAQNILKKYPNISIETARIKAKANHLSEEKKKAIDKSMHSLRAAESANANYFTCLNPACREKLPTIEHYLRHPGEGECQLCPPEHQDFPRFHRLFLEPDIGLKRFRRYLERKRGVNMIWLLKFYDA